MVVYSKFSGYKWSGLLTFPKGSTCYNQAVLLLERVNWTALCCAASSARDGRSCIVKPEIAMGQRHMVRIIEFEDGIRWIARLPIPASAPEPDDYAAATLRKEAACLGLVKEQSKIPVPAVFACITSGHGEIGAPVLLMECLQGNVGMDLNFDFIPAEFKSSFLGEMARIQVRTVSRIRRAGRTANL